jgi:hypothetical protein
MTDRLLRKKEAVCRREELRERNAVCRKLPGGRRERKEVLASGSCRRRRIFHFTSKYAGARGLVAVFLGAKKRPDGL